MQTTILGLGNTLLRDEGFGVHFLKYLAEKYSFPESVNLVDGGTLSYGLLDIISSCERMLVIDVIKSDDRPGSIYRFTHAEMELHRTTPTSAHEVEFFDVLNKAEMLDDLPETIFLCIAPQEYGGEMNMTMTETMYQAFPKMAELLLKELSRWQITPVESAAIRQAG
jgi:hydrogenase maturation protease